MSPLDLCVRAALERLPARPDLCRECGEVDHARTCSWAVHERDVRRTWGWLDDDRDAWARAEAGRV